jgi:two-component system NarL family sensor kinase
VKGLAEPLTRPGAVLAVVRLAALPVFFVAERLVAHPAARAEAFALVLAVAAVYAVAALVAELRGRTLAPVAVLAAADLLFIAALVETSGGPFSQLRHAFFLVPLSSALLLRPALTCLVSAIGVVLYTLIAVTYPDTTAVRTDAFGFELTHVLFLVWMGLASTLLSLVLTRRADEIAALATSRGRLVAQALDAEDRARRRLAEALHDEALQSLLAARQLLDAGDPESAALAREGLEDGVTQIRRAVFDLHPYLLEQAGLRAALQAVAERAGRRAQFEVTVEVDPEVDGLADQLLFSVGRELLANCAKHSAATSVRVEVRRSEGGVELIVADDGRGIEPAAVAAAQGNGHIGLASIVERAEAVGGTLVVERGRAGGTVARMWLPLYREATADHAA